MSCNAWNASNVKLVDFSMLEQVQEILTIKQARMEITTKL